MTISPLRFNHHIIDKIKPKTIETAFNLTRTISNQISPEMNLSFPDPEPVTIPKLKLPEIKYPDMDEQHKNILLIRHNRLVLNLFCSKGSLIQNMHCLFKIRI
jgi:hypothetical protein